MKQDQGPPTWLDGGWGKNKAGREEGRVRELEMICKIKDCFRKIKNLLYGLHKYVYIYWKKQKYGICIHKINTPMSYII